MFLYVFEGLVQIEAIPHPIASIWLDCFEVETLEKHPTAKHCLVWVSFVFAQYENIGRAQPALQCCTLHSLERDHIHLWSNTESKVQNELKTQVFLHILAQKCTILVNFPEKFSYFISKTHKNAVFLYVFEGLVQIEAIPYPIASIWLDCFEVETLEKHPNCKTLSRLGLVCLCPKWKTLVVLNLPCNAAHCTV